MQLGSTGITDHMGIPIEMAGPNKAVPVAKNRQYPTIARKERRKGERGGRESGRMEKQKEKKKREKKRGEGKKKKEGS